jgi:hypothetical protein
MFAREIVDLRAKLSAAHYQHIRELAFGRDMTLRRVARCGYISSRDLPRLYKALSIPRNEQLICTTPVPFWLPRRLRAIEGQIQMAQLLMRREEQHRRFAQTRRVASLARARTRAAKLAPKRQFAGV